jgi:nitroreductase
MKKTTPIEEVIKTRRSIRNFTGDIPPRELVNKIIESGILAPYGGATGMPLHEIRKIFVISTISDKMNIIRDLLLKQININSFKINLIISIFPLLRNKMKPFANRLKTLSRNGIPSLNEAPFYIIVAEKRGFPPIEKQSIAHAMQNMWLTATSLGLGFQLISATGIISKNKTFLKLLGLKKDEYAVDGCLIGYAKNYPPEKNILLDNHVTWID